MIKTIWTMGLMMVALGVWAQGNEKDLSSRVMAPLVMETLTVDESPDWLPSYAVERPHQVYVDNGWTGTSDFSAKVSLAWTQTDIVFLFDVTDDTLITSGTATVDGMSGDHILLKFDSGTAKHNLDKESFDLLLIPDFDKASCRARLLVSSTAAKLIGTPACTLAVKPDKKGYRLLMKIPYRLWDTKPAENMDLSFQAFFGDSDTSGAMDHTLIFFERWPAAVTVEDAKGTLQFAGKAWARIRPVSAKQDGGSLALAVDWGNRTEKPLGLSIEIKDRLGTVVKNYNNVVDMTAGAGANDVSVTLELPKLSLGKEFDVIPKVGSKVAPTAFTFLSNPDGEKSFFCLKWVDRQSRLRRRKVPATRRPDLIEETFRVLAGGGTVLWHAGVYDNSSMEFAELMHPNGEFVINVSPGRSPAADKVPWALFGGGDAMDGMNEPMVLDLSEVAAGDALQRELPTGFVYLHQKKEYAQQAVGDTKVLLLGLTCMKSGGDQYPEIQVTNQDGKVLLTEKLRPAQSQFPQQPHAYVLRVWLGNGDKKILVSNVSKVGSKVEIDFMALLGGGKGLKQKKGTPRIEFAGTPDAEYLNRMLAANLFLCRNYMFAEDGSTFASPPGGSQFLFNLMDHYVLLEELTAWGFIDETRTPVVNLASAPSFQHKRFTKEDSAMGPIRVLAAWNLWRKTGCDERVISALWLPVIQTELSKLADLSMTNRMGLVSGSGEFGVPDQTRGVTVPLQDLAIAALTCGIDFAKAAGKDKKASDWTTLRQRIVDNLHKHLVAAPGGEKLNFSQIFPAAHGIPEQKGIITTVPAGVYVYARDANAKPIPYNGSTRVYDTPYHFAGLPYMFTPNGMILERDKAATLRQTLTFVRSGPALNNKAFIERQVSTFKNSSTQMWTAIALLLTENIHLGGKVLEGIIRYSYDGFSPIPKGADMEISPYAIEEGFSVDDTFDNLGGEKDECRSRSLAGLLKIARLISGVDDHDLKVLNVSPRLPTGWDSVTVSDWLIAHACDANHKTATVDFTYQRRGTGYSLEVKSDRELNEVKVRFGPFRSADRVITVTAKNQRAQRISTKAYGGTRWAEFSIKRVRNTVIEAKVGL